MTLRYSDEELNKALNYDGLAEAERITGKSYKEDYITKFTGFDLHVRNVEAKRRMLESRKDSHYGTTLEEYTHIIQDLGFVLALVVPFQKEEKKETYQIWWQVEGILLSFDTFCGDKVNGGNYYYNWQPNIKEYTDILSSGSWNNGIWIGSHDCREAIRFNIERLQQNGKFICPWIEHPFLWLCHYMDNRTQENYKKINAVRIALLPEYIKRNIGEMV